MTPTDLQAGLDLLPAPVSEIERLGGMGRPWSRAPEFMDLFRRLGTTHERRRSSLEHSADVCRRGRALGASEIGARRETRYPPKRGTAEDDGDAPLALGRAGDGVAPDHVDHGRWELARGPLWLWLGGAARAPRTRGSAVAAGSSGRRTSRASAAALATVMPPRATRSRAPLRRRARLSLGATRYPFLSSTSTSMEAGCAWLLFFAGRRECLPRTWALRSSRSAPRQVQSQRGRAA